VASGDGTDELEKEIIKLEQLPAHDNLARYLYHERCGPHFDTLRVYITRQGAFLFLPPQFAVHVLTHVLLAGRQETSLAQFLRERRRRRDLLSEWEVIQVANQIHAAIHFLHSHSIIHRGAHTLRTDLTLLPQRAFSLSLCCADLRLDNVHLWGAPSNGLVVVGGFDGMDSVAASTYLRLSLSCRTPTCMRLRRCTGAYEIKTGASDSILRAPRFTVPTLYAHSCLCV
jgi:hypothetical protein